MRFQYVIQVARGLKQQQIPLPAKLWLTSRDDRAKWCMWNGKAAKHFRHLHSVQAWLAPTRTSDPHAFAGLSSGLCDLVMYLNANRDSLPDYGKRFRADQPIVTGWAESTINDNHCEMNGKEAEDALEPVYRLALSYPASACTECLPGTSLQLLPCGFPVACCGLTTPQLSVFSSASVGQHAYCNFSSSSQRRLCVLSGMSPPGSLHKLLMSTQPRIAQPGTQLRELRALHSFAHRWRPAEREDESHYCKSPP